MKRIILPLAAFAMTHCTGVDENGPPSAGSGTAASQAPAGFTQPLTRINGPFTVTIMEGGRRISVCRTASPNIEETRWLREQEQIVVKSRGNHGPATVQLFDSRSGRQLGSVMAYEVANGDPAWAAGMGE